MTWWEIFLIALPSVITGIFSIVVSLFLYKLNKKDKEKEKQLAEQNKLLENYRKKSDNYKNNKQTYKNWLFEKRFDSMKEISAVLYSNYRNALDFLLEYGTTVTNLQTKDINVLSENYNRCKADLESFIKLAYSTQFYIDRDISAAFAEFTKEMQQVIKLYEKALSDPANYKVSLEEQKQNNELAKSINNKCDIIINKFQQIIDCQTTDLTEI